jgi:hypothetical protein
MHTRTRRRGFGVTELLVVVFIAAILVAIFMKAIQKGREDAAPTECINNLKQIGLACLNFESTFKRLPPLYGGSDGTTVNSAKFRNTWASTHVFLLPYCGEYHLYRKMRVGDPAVYDPNHNGVLNNAIPLYVCPADPSMVDGIVRDGVLGGSSYAVNAQVFAPLADERIIGGQMYPASKPNFTDRGVPIARFSDGPANIILFMHTYALCGPNQGSAWGYGAGVGEPPSPVHAYQPWSRASYIKQTHLTPKNAAAFQNQPNPYATQCRGTDPATPHDNAMIILLGDATVRAVTTEISADLWNKACLPNDHVVHGDWGN